MEEVETTAFDDVCQECGMPGLSPTDKHTYDDCLRYKEEIGEAPNLIFQLDKTFVRIPLSKHGIELVIQVVQILKRDIYGDE